MHKIGLATVFENLNVISFLNIQKWAWTSKY